MPVLMDGLPEGPGLFDIKSVLPSRLTYQSIFLLGPHIKLFWNAALLEEVTGFPDVAPNDDLVDAMAILGRYLHAMPLGEGEQAYVAPPPIEGAVRMQDGEMLLTETLDSMFEQREEALNASYSWERI